MPARRRRGGRGFGSSHRGGIGRHRGFGMGRRRYGGGSRISPIQAALLNRPQTDQTKIIFPLVMGNFSKHEFNPVLAQNRVTEQDIDMVINEVQSQPNIRISQSWIICIIPFLMIAFFIGMFLFMFTQASKLAESSFILIPIVMFGSMFVLIAVIITITCIAQKSALSQLNKRQQQIQAVLTRYNQIWASRDVSWRMGTMGAWLQLDLDFAIRAMQNNLLAGGAEAQNAGMAAPAPVPVQPAAYQPLGVPVGGIGQAQPLTDPNPIDTLAYDQGFQPAKY